MKDQPNVLLICADHWSGRMGGWAGNHNVLTPTIDRLARNGVAFSNAYSACPVCVPARRTLMTGMSARGHGLNSNKSDPMPDAPTMAQCFRDAGYQAHAVGKLHVNPRRSRIGFDDVLACEEGRHPAGMPDDWEMFLAEKGVGGRQYDAAATQNDYMVTPWHLPDDCHPTNWAAREMSRVIKRRDRARPGFWYLSFIAPHPPLWPLLSYLDQYQQLPVDPPVVGRWMEELAGHLPPLLGSKKNGFATSDVSAGYIALVRRAFFAMITHIDHQIRAVLGTLREEGLAGNTLVAFTSDHGDMLGQHGLWGKCLFYEDSTRIPFIVAPPPGIEIGKRGRADHRLVELADMMPTLLDVCGVPIPSSVEGRSVFSTSPRSEIFGEFGNGSMATRMLRQGHHKLIYYPAGNIFQLFDIDADPVEERDLAADAGHQGILRDLQDALASNLYGGDTAWCKDGEWVGLPAADPKASEDFNYSGQRGHRF